LERVSTEAHIADAEAAATGDAEGAESDAEGAESDAGDSADIE